jgi:hypothetical protein
MNDDDTDTGLERERIIRRLAEGGMDAAVLEAGLVKGAPGDALLAEICRAVEGGGPGGLRAEDPAEAERQAAEVGKFYDRFSEHFNAGHNPTTKASLIKGYRAARKYNPGLSARDFCGTR